MREIIYKNISDDLQRVTIILSTGLPYDRYAGPGRFIHLTPEEHDVVAPLDPNIWELGDGSVVPPPVIPPPDLGPPGPQGPPGPPGPQGPPGQAGLLIALNTWGFVGSLLTWADPMYVALAGLSDGRNTIPAGSATVEDGEILYVYTNLDAGPNDNLTPMVAPIEAVVPVANLFIIMRRVGIRIYTQMPVAIYTIQP
jgi:hypothetical protein